MKTATTNFYSETNIQKTAYKTSFIISRNRDIQTKCHSMKALQRIKLNKNQTALKTSLIMTLFYNEITCSANKKIIIYTVELK